MEKFQFHGSFIHKLVDEFNKVKSVKDNVHFVYITTITIYSIPHNNKDQISLIVKSSVYKLICKPCNAHYMS